MSILDKARTVELKIARALSRAASHAVGPSAAEPLEIVHAIVDEVERQTQSGGRGARIFPFNCVTLSLLARSRDARARLEAVVCGTPSLQERLHERLRSAGCEVADLRVDVAYVGRASSGWNNPQFHVAFDRVAVTAATAPSDPAPARVEVTVLRGAADRRTYTFATPRIEIGRGAEVRDNTNRLVRINHIAFTEGSPGENQTVSRRHAHVARDPASGEHRLYDDGSVHGSGIVRDGRTIPVPTGSRGVRLQSGDEIVLGEARMRVRIENSR